MEIGRRAVIAGGAAAMLGGRAGSAAAAPANPLAAILSGDRKAIKVVRVFAPVGAPSEIAEIEVAGERLKGTPLVHFLMRKADKVAVYSAPPNLAVAERAAGKGGEILYVTRGKATIRAGKGKHACGRGALVLLEEGASYTEKAGPRGYAAIKIRLQD